MTRRYNDGAVAAMLQEAIDNLAAINDAVRATQSVALITTVAGHVFTAETMILVAAQELGFGIDDIDARGPHDG